MLSKKLPLLESTDSMNEERMSIPGKGDFVVSVSAENNYIKFQLIPDSKMLDSIAEVGADRFKKDAIKFLSSKFGVDFTEDSSSYAAGYTFRFHVSELTKGFKDIFK